MIDQESVARYLHLKGMSGKLIHGDLKKTLGDSAISYSSVTKAIRAMAFIHSCPEDTLPPEINVQTHNMDLILRALRDEPFSSVRALAKTTGIPKSTVYRILVDELGYVNRHLKWIPHLLSDDQRRQRVLLCRQLLTTLQRAKHRGWNNFVTGDESWFYLSYHYETKWVNKGEDPGLKVKRMISTKKLMLSIYFSPKGFMLIDSLPLKTKFNAQYYVNNILQKISNIYEETRNIDNRKLVLHIDNAKPHTARLTTEFLNLNNMKRAPHPPYSPDLAPCDFFLFGYVKEMLKGKEFDDPAELLTAVIEILDHIDLSLLNDVFSSWLARLQFVIENDGIYYQ